MFSLKKNFSFFEKVFLYSIGIAFITLFTSYLLELVFLDSFYLSRKKSYLIETANQIEKIQEDKIALESFIDLKREISAIDIKVFNPKDFNITHGQKFILNAVEEKNNSFTIQSSELIGAVALIYNRKLKNGNWVSLTTSLTVMSNRTYELDIFKLLTVILSTIVSLFLGYFFSKKITKDIEKISGSAKEIAKLRFPKDIVIDREDEIGDLSRSIDTMSEKIMSSIESLKSFVGNASHELKTPIAVISSYAHSIVKKEYRSEKELQMYSEIILKRAKEMEELVNNLLIISRIDSKVYVPKKDKVDLRVLVEESFEKYDFLEFEKDLEVEIKIPAETFVFVDIKLFKLVIDNICQNALKYSKEYGVVSVDFKDEILRIGNSLNQKIEVEKEKLLEPFYRGKNSENELVEGTGLGLSIVKKSLELQNLKYRIDIEEVGKRKYDIRFTEERFIFTIDFNSAT